MALRADGGHSTLRELLGAEDEERSFYEDRWCIADVRIDTREEPVRKAYLDGVPTEGGAIWYHQMADGVWRTDWQIGHLPDADAETTPERATARLRRLLGAQARFELVWVGPGRFKQSAAQSSFDAWTRYYKQDENSPNALVSYYSKGALIALGLDLRIRSHTQQAKSLDDVMLLMWERYGRDFYQGKPQGIPEDAMPALILEATGYDATDFIARYVEGCEDLPLKPWLAEQGLKLEWQASSKLPSLNARLRQSAGQCQLATVFTDHGFPAAASRERRNDRQHQRPAARVAHDDRPSFKSSPDCTTDLVPVGSAPGRHRFQRRCGGAVMQEYPGTFDEFVDRPGEINLASGEAPRFKLIPFDELTPGTARQAGDAGSISRQAMRHGRADAGRSLGQPARASVRLS